MLQNIQGDPRWRNDPMGMIEDKLWRFGCLVTSYANIIGITPKELNQWLRDNKGYQKLAQGDDCPVNRESMLWHPAIVGKDKYFKSIDHEWDKYNIVEGDNIRYALKVLHPVYNTGHWINFITATPSDMGLLYSVFDVDTGVLYIKNVEQILKVKQIII